MYKSNRELLSTISHPKRSRNSFSLYSTLNSTPFAENGKRGKNLTVFLECNLKVSDVGNRRKMGQNRRRRTRYAENAAPPAALYIGRRGRARQRTRSDARAAAAAEGKLQSARDHDLGSLVGKWSHLNDTRSQ